MNPSKFARLDTHSFFLNKGRFRCRYHHRFLPCDGMSTIRKQDPFAHRAGCCGSSDLETYLDFPNGVHLPV